jgi:hypothetical protein
VPAFSGSALTTLLTAARISYNFGGGASQRTRRREDRDGVFSTCATGTARLVGRPEPIGAWTATRCAGPAARSSAARTASTRRAIVVADANADLRRLRVRTRGRAPQVSVTATPASCFPGSHATPA